MEGDINERIAAAAAKQQQKMTMVIGMKKKREENDVGNDVSAYTKQKQALEALQGTDKSTTEESGKWHVR